MRVIIAAAGTGGHINPGIAIANKIKQEEKDSEIIFIGTSRGLENDLVVRAGYELKRIESYGISRSLTIKNIKRFVKTMASINEVKKIIKEFKPDIIVGTGGYICISVLKAAQKMKVPYVIHESNVLPGIATKLLAKKAKKVFLGFEEAKNNLPKGTKTIYTGTPTKVKDLNLSTSQKEKLKEEMNLDKDLPLVLVFGGSQGAKTINEAFIGIIKKRKENEEDSQILITNNNKLTKTINLNSNVENYQIIWAVGQKQYESVKEELQKDLIDIDNIHNIIVKPYIYNMEEMLNICDLVVARSGAMTITEIERVGKASIFIPYPYAAENHQEYNARNLERKGCAKVILDKDLNADILEKTIDEIIENKENLKEMERISKSLDKKNVEDIIYTEIKSITEEERKNKKEEKRKVKI